MRRLRMKLASNSSSSSSRWRFTAGSVTRRLTLGSFRAGPSLSLLDGVLVLGEPSGVCDPKESQLLLRGICKVQRTLAIFVLCSSVLAGGAVVFFVLVGVVA